MQSNVLVSRRMLLALFAVAIMLSSASQMSTAQSTIDNQSEINTSNSINDLKSNIQASIDTATYFTIKNATTPAVTVDPKNGNLYAVYFRGENGGGNIYLSKSSDSGQTFSDPVRINSKVGEVQLDAQWSAPGLGVGPNSQVYVAWYSANFSEPEKYPYGQVTMRFASSLDGGKTFQPEINPAPGDPKGEQSYPFMTVSEDNRIYISYLNLDYSKLEDSSGTPTVLRVVTSSDSGKSFAPSAVADKGACQCCATVAALGPDGELYTSSRSVYKNVVQSVDNATKTEYQNNEKNVSIIRDITVEHSLDKGAANVFSEPSRVGQDNWFMNGCPDAGPGMDFDKKGRLHLAWFTGSEEASQGQGFYYTNSDDKGATFSKPVPIHLLSTQWIPPTTQYLATDSADNSWIVFVNSEGLQKSADYEESFQYEGNGTIQLTVIDRNSNVLKNGTFASGDITKHYPYTSEANGIIAISWMDGDDVKLAFINTNKEA